MFDLEDGIDYELETTKDIVVEEDGEICKICNGSGEGRYEGARCPWCKGKGVE